MARRRHAPEQILAKLRDVDVTRVAFNDIVAFSQLHYGATFPGHAADNECLTRVFRSAVTRPKNVQGGIRMHTAPLDMPGPVGPH